MSDFRFVPSAGHLRFIKCMSSRLFNKFCLFLCLGSAVSLNIWFFEWILHFGSLDCLNVRFFFGIYFFSLYPRVSWINDFFGVILLSLCSFCGFTLFLVFTFYLHYTTLTYHYTISFLRMFSLFVVLADSGKHCSRQDRSELKQAPGSDILQTDTIKGMEDGLTWPRFTWKLKLMRREADGEAIRQSRKQNTSDARSNWIRRKWRSARDKQTNRASKMLWMIHFGTLSDVCWCSWALQLKVELNTPPLKCKQMFIFNFTILIWVQYYRTPKRHTPHI